MIQYNDTKTTFFAEQQSTDATADTVTTIIGNNPARTNSGSGTALLYVCTAARGFLVYFARIDKM